MAKTAAQLKELRAQLKAEYQEKNADINKQIRVAERREEQARIAEQRKEDRKEADEVLAFLRDAGLPNGKGVAFLKKLQNTAFDSKGDNLFMGTIVMMKKSVEQLEHDDNRAPAAEHKGNADVQQQV